MFKSTYNGGLYLFKKILKVDFPVKKSLAILSDSSFAENFTCVRDLL